MDKIPHRVNQITELYDLENYSTELKQRRKKVCGFRDLGCQIKWQIQSRVNGHKYPNYGENKWAIWGKNLPSLGKHYDLAISYMNGFPNYYVIDKVNADKKVLWIHNEFEKLDVNYDYERNYYEKADRVVTISRIALIVLPEFIRILEKRLLYLKIFLHQKQFGMLQSWFRRMTFSSIRD